MEMAEDLGRLDQILQGLSDDGAVINGAFQRLRVVKVAMDRRSLIASIVIEDVAALDPRAAVMAGIPVVLDLQHPSANIPGMRGEETFDVITINWFAPAEAEVLAHRLRTTKIAPAHRIDRNPRVTLNDAADAPLDAAE